jgi:hypothetical protein
VNFQTLALIKHPLVRAWSAMRDELPQLVAHMEDIESITTTERTTSPGQVAIINIWRAKPKLPEMLARHFDTTKFAWTDHAVWDEQTKTCRWHIEPHVFSDYFKSHGETVFQPAMGGRGTRITFSGEAEMKLGPIGSGLSKMLENTLLKGAMSFVQGSISNNYRKIIEALEKHLNRETSTVSTPPK